MSLLDRLPHSVTGLTRIAAGIALLGLGVFTIGLLVPQPLPVIFSMSIGHGLGAIAVLLYFLAVAIDSTRRGRGSVLPSNPIERSSNTPTSSMSTARPSTSGPSTSGPPTSSTPTSIERD